MVATVQAEECLGMHRYPYKLLEIKRHLERFITELIIRVEKSIWVIPKVVVVAFGNGG